MRIKTILGFVLAGALVFSSCAKKEDKATDLTDLKEGVNVNIMALKGPTGIGMVKLIEESSEVADGDKYNFQIVASVDEVVTALAKGEADIASLPANLSSVLYNNTQGNIEVLAINTLGVLYIVENGNSVNSLEDLKGKTIFASGKGATPEYALNYILGKNGVDINSDINLEWRSEHAECVAALSQTPNSLALIPEPFVTTALNKNDDFTVVLDLDKEWENIADKDGSLITGVLVGRKDFIEANREVVDLFLKNYRDSINFVNANVDEAAELVGKYEIASYEVASKAIPRCNIVYIDGIDMKESLSGYLSTLFEQNPKAVGAKLPEEDFYYIVK